MYVDAYVCACIHVCTPLYMYIRVHLFLFCVISSVYVYRFGSDGNLAAPQN